MSYVGSREHNSLRSMWARCRNPKHKSYKDYGGRGISVDPTWLDFRVFREDMGVRPVGTTLDRKDPELGYTKANYKWSTEVEQQNNRRSNKRVAFLGDVLTVAEWELRLGFRRCAIGERLRRGWSVERALTTPARAYATK